jgi:tetratricopeptide (TPR) repeat protein
VAFVEQSTQMRRVLVVALTAITVAGAQIYAQSGSAADPGTPYYQFLLGLHLEMAGDAPGAEAAYKQAEKLDPSSAEIPAALAALYARVNRSADAIAAGERAIKADPTNTEANWILGNLYARAAEATATPPADRPGYASRAISKLEHADANAHPSVPVLLGRMYLGNRQFDKAIALLSPFVTEQPDQIEAVALLADAYQAVGRDGDAVALLQQSAEDAPELYSALAEVYESSGRWRDAAKAYEGAVEDRPQYLPLRAQWATALLNSGEAQRAREVLEEGSASTSRNARALYLLAEAQRRTHDVAAAEATARKLIALDTKNVAGYRELAQIFQSQHEYQKVVGVLEPIVTGRFRTADGAVMSDPSFRGAYFELVTAYEQLKQYDKAMAVLAQARQVSANDPEVIVRTARTQVSAGKTANAVSTLQAALKQFPDEVSLKIELATVYERQKKFAEAEAIFHSLISADSKDANALNSLGYMLAERGQRLDEAVGFVQNALAIEPGNPAFLDSLGWALYKQGKYDVAEQPLREASEKLPTVSVIQDHFGDLLAHRGAYQDAIAAWQRALDGDGDAIVRSDVENKIKSARQKIGKSK